MLHSKRVSKICALIAENMDYDNSYGFRPSRSASQAIQKCKEYMDNGYRWAVDIDLERYFDTVNYDKLILKLKRGKSKFI